MTCLARPYVTLTALARQLGLPARWLKAEALAGRLPHLRVGCHLKFEVPAEQAALSRRAEEAGDAWRSARREPA